MEALTAAPVGWVLSSGVRSVLDPGRFGLELHPAKIRPIEFGRYAVERRKKRGTGKPETFDFLVFTSGCGRNHKNGSFEVERKTVANRLRSNTKSGEGPASRPRIP